MCRFSLMRVMGALYENVHDKRKSVMSDNSIFDTKVFHAPLLQFSTKIIIYYNVLPDKGYKFFFTHALHLLRNHNGTRRRSILKAATVKGIVLLHFGFRFSVLLREVFTESDYRLFKVAVL